MKKKSPHHYARLAEKTVKVDEKTARELYAYDGTINVDVHEHGIGSNRFYRVTAIGEKTTMLELESKSREVCERIFNAIDDNVDVATMQKLGMVWG